MDGFKRKLRKSLQYKLSLWLCLAIMAFALAAGALSFFAIFEESNELQDDQLRQVAALFNNRVAEIATPANQGTVAFASPLEFSVLVEILTPSGTEVLGIQHPSLALPQDVQEGIQTITLHDIQWRILVKTLAPQQRLVVAQKIALRDEMAIESATAALAPYVILIPVLLLIIGYLIRQMFKPVTQLAKELDQRSEQDLRQIERKELPSEVLPFVDAINRMLVRVDQSIAQQRRFIADAAHEMRTPLTALSLQMEGFEATEMSAQAQQRLAILKGGLLRNRLLLNQLLALAHAQQDSREEKTEVSIQHVFRRVLEDLLPLAEAKQIDVGVVTETDADLFVQELDLVSLVRNLVDNAIRYTPKGGKIDLSLVSNSNQVILTIEDSGPGIPEAEVERVFDPFYRVVGSNEIGSGLGLSIVKAITARMGAEIRIENRKDKPGLLVRVHFPK
ncbi:MAG: ATP-binding protein [Arenimonas sp.]